MPLLRFGTTPKYWLVVFDNFLPSTTCTTIGSLRYGKASFAEIIGPYILEFTSYPDPSPPNPPPCEWKIITAHPTITYWGNSYALCEADVGNACPDIAISLYKYSTTRFGLRVYTSGACEHVSLFQSTVWVDGLACDVPYLFFANEPNLYVAPGAVAWAIPYITGGWNVRCPGGGALYTDTDLSAYVGRVISVNMGGQEVCFTVTAYTGAHDSDGAIIVEDDYDNCEDCCADV